MRKINRHLLVVVILVLGLMVVSSFAADQSGKLKVQIPAAPQLYSSTPQPLAVDQCGQCHPSVFGNIKENGVKHRFDCQNCHKAFHVYNPRKGNYDAIMPKCDTCHNEPHGAKVTNCLSCHTNPHTPRKVEMSATLANACGQCHPGPKGQLEQFKSKHSKVECSRCHTAHGLKPSCFNCHKPHVEKQEASTCTKCHPAHHPLQISYTNDTPPSFCGACHTKVFSKWQKTRSKHGKVTCALCHHDKHKYIPQCTECHGSPHPAGILTRYPKCLSCHMDVHDLPTDMKK